MKVGHLIGLNPSHYSPTLVKQIVVDSIGNKTTGYKIPPFQLVFLNPSILTQNKETVRTKAYSIEIKQQDKAAATKLFQNASLGTLHILPGQMRHAHPPAYKNGLKLQNHIIENKYIVPVTGITKDMMFYMKPSLQEIKGVHDVFPTQNTQKMEDGTYSLINPSSTLPG